MQIKSLTVANFRVFEQAKFDFQPGMNLLVGINGAGKSTVLDVIRDMLSQSLPSFTVATRRQARFFDKQNDISISSKFLNVQMHLKAGDILINHVINLSREEYKVTAVPTGQVRDRTENLDNKNELTFVDENGLVNKLGLHQIPKKGENQFFAVFFSPHRSVIDSRHSTTGGQAAAFADALENRALYLNEFAEWWHTREELAKENEKDKRLIDILNGTVSNFLAGYTNLHVVENPKPSLWVIKHGIHLNISQLSDGERSILTLVFDLSRRLTLANPKLDNPQRDGKAVVLIDELDLHLHPGWQRTIVRRLTETFPNCQFIATTHSPLIIGEVAPEKIILINNGKATHCGQSLGMDTNWILKHVMGTPERDLATTHKFKEIETLIENEEYDEADDKIKQLRLILRGDDPDLVSLQTRIDLIEFLSDEVNNKADEENKDK